MIKISYKFYNIIAGPPKNLGQKQSVLGDGNGNPVPPAVAMDPHGDGVNRRLPRGASGGPALKPSDVTREP
jgi:hypothetical protein